MSSNENDTRTVLGLTAGSKICLLVAIPFLVAAAYFLWVPISIPGTDGRFGCGSAFSPPSDDFPKNVCGSVNHVYQVRAGSLLAVSLLVAAAGVFFFGVTRRVEQRKRRDPVLADEEPVEN